MLLFQNQEEQFKLRNTSKLISICQFCFQTNNQFSTSHLDILMNRSQQKMKRNPSAFLKNTYDILENPEYNSIIRWGEDSGFVIKDQIRFEKQILPFYFKHQKYTSYVRQLNMYGFHKHRTAKNQIYFKHEQFRKGRLQLTEIKRKPEHKKKSKTDDLECEKEKQTDMKVEMQNEQQQQDGEDQQEEEEENNLEQSLKIEYQQPQQPLKQNSISQEQNPENPEPNTYDQNYVKLCELLLKQNKILIKTQQQFRNSIIQYKKLSIQYEKQQILSLERLCQINHIEQQNNPLQPNTSKTTLFTEKSRRNNELQAQQVNLLSLLNRQLMSSIKELNDTNYFMFSSTSIEGGYSNYKIQAQHS